MIYMNKKIMILATLICMAVLATIYASFTFIERQDKVAVRIDIFPSSAAMTIEGQKTGPGTTYLRPGTYAVRASHDGFQDVSSTLRVNSSTKNYVVSLEPITEDAKKWVDEHQEEYVHIRQLGEKSIRQSGEYFYEKNPIAKKLPYKTFMYAIGYQKDPSDPSENSIIVTIDAPEGYRQSALYQIRRLGFDPTDLNILFRDYENPFPL